MEIPKQLQNPEIRFVLLGGWDKWKNNKTKEVIEVKPEDYLKYKSNKDWKPLGKMPFEKDWQNNGYSFNDKRLLEHIGAGKNIGVIAGYGGLVILDIDDPKLGEELEKTLKTFTIKTGSGGRHFYFYVKQ